MMVVITNHAWNRCKERLKLSKEELVSSIRRAFLDEAFIRKRDGHKEIVVCDKGFSYVLKFDGADAILLTVTDVLPFSWQKTGRKMFNKKYHIEKIIFTNVGEENGLKWR